MINNRVNPYKSERGPQSEFESSVNIFETYIDRRFVNSGGYNQCNSTTQGDDSDCQTVRESLAQRSIEPHRLSTMSLAQLIINSIDDFCLWGLPGGPKELSTIGESEAATVAYCVKVNTSFSSSIRLGEGKLTESLESSGNSWLKTNPRWCRYWSSIHED